MNTTTPTFAKQDNLKFFRTLNSKVNNYFKENNLDKTGILFLIGYENAFLDLFAS
jgi:hypothetical protein